MANRVLPSRERVRGAKAAHNMQMTASWYRDINAVVVAYLSEELKTEAEWHDSIERCLLCAEDVVHSGSHYYGDEGGV